MEARGAGIGRRMASQPYSGHDPIEGLGSSSPLKLAILHGIDLDVDTASQDQLHCPFSIQVTGLP